MVTCPYRRERHAHGEISQSNRLTNHCLADLRKNLITEPTDFLSDSFHFKLLCTLYDFLFINIISFPHIYIYYLLKHNLNSKFEVTKCRESSCGLCKHIKEGSTFNFKDTNNLRKRIAPNNQHLRHENLRMIPMRGHIATCSDKNPKYFMFPFYKMNCDSIIARKEKYFINSSRYKRHRVEGQIRMYSSHLSTQHC